MAQHCHVASFLSYDVVLDHGLEFSVYQLRDFEASEKLNDSDVYMQDVGIGI